MTIARQGGPIPVGQIGAEHEELRGAEEQGKDAELFFVFVIMEDGLFMSMEFSSPRFMAR